MRVNKEV